MLQSHRESVLLKIIFRENRQTLNQSHDRMYGLFFERLNEIYTPQSLDISKIQRISSLDKLKNKNKLYVATLVRSICSWMVFMENFVLPETISA